MRRTARFGPAKGRASGGSRLRFPLLLSGVSGRFWIFAGFLALVFLTGGGSRDDITSLVILRPACALLAAYAFTVAGPGAFARVRVPLLLLLALAVWMVIQLIPLPPEIWSGLPRRAALLDVDRLAGIEGTWRPISLSPSKTMNALASLVVPATGLLLYAVQVKADRLRILGLLLVAAFVSTLLGIGQFAAGGSGPLYLYEVTNYGSPVGLFSNRNHNAVFLASTFVIAGHLFAEHRRLSVRNERSGTPVMIAGVCLLVLITLLFSGSRAGLLIGALALALGTVLYMTAWGKTRDGHGGSHGIMRYLPVALVGGVALAGIFLFSQSASFDRLVSLSSADEIRAQVFPQIVQMARDNWAFGTGFGSFEYAYRAYESSEWLNQTYLNNAHDDWLQWIIEGGLPAVAIFVAFVVWFVRACVARWRVRAADAPQTRLTAMAAGILLLLFVASALDYPLRVPSIMLYAALMIALIADPPESVHKTADKGSRAGVARRKQLRGSER